MDGLYSDLDNYNEANVVSELRSENMELKIKLEKCTVIMENLQKDYDRVSAEFKRLEINYSSLLKTAKAEIERKTQIISNLNMEKDTMVLNSIHNRNSFRYKRILALERKNKDSQNSDSDLSKNKDRKEEVSDLKQRTNPDGKWKEEKRLPSEDTTTSNNTESAHRLPHSDGISAHCPASSKENSYALKENEPFRTETTASSIANRRKSKPASISKYSSDDESEGVSNRDHTKEDIKKHRDYNKHAFKPSSRRRQPEIVRYRDKRDKFEISRHHRPLSTDRSKDQRRLMIDAENNHHRLDSRRRAPGSPPPNYYHHRSRRETRSDKPVAYEHSSHRHIEKYPVKHKLEEYDAPSGKRVRTEERSHIDDLRRQRDKHQISIMEHHTVTSCQSPEMLLDNLASQPIKEIKLQAAEETVLDDPRKLSKRYISDDVKNVLSAATGMNVDIVPLNKTDWGIDIVPIPDVLNPSKYDAQLVNDIYIGIDDPISNMSVESGEISDSEASSAKSTYVDNKEAVEVPLSHNNKSDPVIPSNITESQLHNRVKGQKDKDHKESAVITEVEKNQGTIITKYRIPKVKPDKDNQMTDSLDSKNTKLDRHKCNTTTELIKNKKPQDISQISKAIVVNDLELSDENSDSVETPVTHLNTETKNKKKSKQFRSENLSKDTKREEFRQKNHKTKNPSPDNEKKSLPKETFGRNAGDSVNSLDSNCTKILEKAEQKIAHPLKECDTKHIEKKSGDIDEIDCILKHCVSKKKETKDSDKAEPHAPNESNSKLIIEKKSVDEAKTQKASKDSNSKLMENRCGDKMDTRRCSRNRNSEFKENTAKKLMTPEENLSQASSTLIEINNTKTRCELKDRITVGKDNDAGERKTEVSKKSCEKFIESKFVKETERHNLRKSHNTDEKRDSKKDVNHIQAKYSYLFGDASLISPEDLGINPEKSQKLSSSNYMPICEDAIDSNDLHIDKFNKADSTKPITQAADDNVVTASDANLDKLSKNEIKENSEEVYKNIVAADIKETDVVRTVIISTGVQPDMLDGTVEPALTKVREVVNKPLQKDILKNVQEASCIKALATSTPHKNAHVDNVETGSKPAVISSNDSKESRNNNVIENKPSEQNEKDAPDVRIFVKRKRKVIKTATPSKA